MNNQAIWAGVLAVALTGCLRISTTRTQGGHGSEDERVSVQRNEAASLPVDVAQLTVINEFGPVTVTGVDEGFGWTWELTCWGRDDAAAQELASHFRLETETGVEGQDVRLRLTRNLGTKERGRFTSRLEIRVARTASVEVRNSFGEVRVNSLTGSADLQTQNAQLVVEQVSGEVTASTAFAELTAEDVGPAELSNQNGALRAVNVAGPLMARTSFGPLTVQGVRGPAILRNQNGVIEAVEVSGDLEAETSFSGIRVEEITGNADLRNLNGAIHADEVAGLISARTSFGLIELDSDSQSIEARNQNGGIRITARSEGVEWIDASTSFSPIEITLPARLKPLIRAETSFGEIRSDFPVVLWNSIREDAFRSDPAQPKLTLRTQNGHITVREGR